MDVLLQPSSMKTQPRSPSVQKAPDFYMHQIQRQHYVGHARSHLDHVSALDIDHDPTFVRQTTAVCTLGELWNTDEQISAMVKGGMNILRLNLSMGSYEYYSDVIHRVRALERSSGYQPPVGIAVDISVPPLRTGLIGSDVDAEITLQTDQLIKLSLNSDMKDATCDELIYLDTQYFPSFVQCILPGDSIHLDDGLLTLQVQTIEGDTVNCVVQRGGQLGSYKRVDLPQERTHPQTFTTTYVRDLAFATESKVDYVFTGYACNKHQLIEAKKLLNDEIKLFAKVETREAVQNLEELMEVADGIIIERNKLGLAFPTEKVFQLQKQIIAKCNIFHKPVFVFAQLLESMRFKPRATRAEITDVANAVIDGADGLILTVETSRGLFPKEALQVLHMTCREAESAIYHERFWSDLKDSRDIRGLSSIDPAYLAALAAVEASATSNASAIFVVTITGRSASAIASFRPACPVVAVIRSPRIGRFCHSFRGLHPFIYTGEKLSDWSTDMDARLNAAMDYSWRRGFIGAGDQVVIVTGWRAGSGATNTVRVVQMPSDRRRLSIVNSQANVRDVNWFD